MKANEFLKEHGIKKTKIICDCYFDFTHVTNDARMFISEKHYVEFAPHFKSSLSDAVKISDLKRLVESHELIESCGGLEDATKVCIQLHCKGGDASKLKEAIADVESCQ